MILSEHLVRCDTDGIDFKTPWYKWTNGRLQQIFLMVSFLLYFFVLYLHSIYSYSKLLVPALPNWLKPVFGPFGQSKMHLTLSISA